MAKERKRTGMRTCKQMDGDKKCTKYAQWKDGNKGCYCHKHFRMMAQNNAQRGSVIVMMEALIVLQSTIFNNRLRLMNNSLRK